MLLAFHSLNSEGAWLTRRVVEWGMVLLSLGPSLSVLPVLSLGVSELAFRAVRV